MSFAVTSQIYIPFFSIHSIPSMLPIEDLICLPSFNRVFNVKHSLSTSNSEQCSHI